MAEDDDQFDALERTIHEIEALSIIFNDESDNQTSSFSVLSKNEYKQAQILITDYPSAPSASADGVTAFNTPTLSVEIVQHINNDSILLNDEIRQQMKIQFTLLPGYPSKVSAFISDVSIGNLASRTQRDTLAKVLNEKAAELIGCEALMEIIQEGKDAGINFMMNSIASISDREEGSDKKDGDGDHDANNKSLLSRRWLWVHHITNTNRRKDIVTEANERSLSGYLKSGYPGIVVVEGDSVSCDEFVRWIKGNKSQPGGFGRNWGHHVRGEVILQDEKSLTNIFQDVGEDLSVLSSLCRDVGLEDEFKLYVMQH